MSDDLFPIVIDVEESRVGSVLRKLDAMPGIVTIHLQIAKQRAAQQPKQFKQVEARQQLQQLPAVVKRRAVFDQTAALRVGSVKNVIAQALGHGAMHRNLLATLLQKSGFSPITVNSVLSKMSADKAIQRVSPGTYKLTKLGVTKYLNARHTNSFHNGNRGASRGNQAGLRYLILTTLQNGDISHADLKELLVTNGYVTNNIYSLVPKMLEEGLIKRVGDAYEITEKGKKACQPSLRSDHKTGASEDISNNAEGAHHGESA